MGKLDDRQQVKVLQDVFIDALWQDCADSHPRRTSGMWVWVKGMPSEDKRHRIAPVNLAKSERLLEADGDWSVIIAQTSEVAWHIAFVLEENGCIPQNIGKVLAIGEDVYCQVDSHVSEALAAASIPILYDARAGANRNPDAVVSSEMLEYHHSHPVFSYEELSWHGEPPAEYIRQVDGERHHRIWARAFGDLSSCLEKMGAGYLSREEVVQMMEGMSCGLMEAANFPVEPEDIKISRKQWHCRYTVDVPDYAEDYRKEFEKPLGVLEIWQSFLADFGLQLDGRKMDVNKLAATAQTLGIEDAVKAYLSDGVPLRDLLA